MSDARIYLVRMSQGEQCQHGICVRVSTGSIASSTREDSWGSATEKKRAGKCTKIGESMERNRHCSQILSYRRVRNRLYSSLHTVLLKKIDEFRSCRITAAPE
ncbi:hypothetical protein Y032_0060g3088 [Ancylostoma ceylanicum]|uniref:Uncharacterized protein n=1 Tax=Ancylostoma ceylanicum TaxID=53326 RepID=A0A016U339_9BILA|nr:hypothetical protein Y032_0060g3088 [Ancylostoma ceylanicum]